MTEYQYQEYLAGRIQLREVFGFAPLTESKAEDLHERLAAMGAREDAVNMRVEIAHLRRRIRALQGAMTRLKKQIPI